MIAERVFHVGELGAGKTVKLINNMLVAAQTALAGEALALAEAAGIDPAKLYEAVSASSGDSNAWRNMVPKVLDPPPVAGFRLELMAKDLRLALAVAEELGCFLEIASMARHRYERAISQGLGSQDVSQAASLDLTISH